MSYSKHKTEFIVQIDSTEWNLIEGSHSVSQSAGQVGREVTFDVSYEPTSLGTKSTIMTISSPSCDDYTFPIVGKCLEVVRRRSTRKTSKQIEEEQRAQWKQYLKEERIDGLEIQNVPLKGRGIFSTRPFHKGEYVVEYAGDLITPKEAEVREKKYSKNTDKYGSYMYYFEHKGTKRCIDATIESGKFGRLLNHSCKTPNCTTKVLEVRLLTHIGKSRKQNPKIGCVTERHLRKQNPKKNSKNVFFGCVTERHLWKQNPDKNPECLVISLLV